METALRRWVNGCVGASLFFFMSACATTSNPPIADDPVSEEAPAEVESEVAPVEKEVSAPQVNYLQEAEALWKERDDSLKLQQALQLYLLEFHSNPTKEVGARLARGHYLLGDFHLISSEGIVMAYEQGVYWGNQTLALNQAYQAKLDGPEGLSDAMMALGEDDVEALYWTTANLIKWARYKGFEALLDHEGEIKMMISRVESLAPEFHYGAVNRFWGAFYAVTPAFVGGSLKKSKVYFEKSLSDSPGNFTTKVLMADTYATAALDRGTFERILSEVLEGDPAIIPELSPEFRLEQKKARELMGLSDVLF